MNMAILDREKTRIGKLLHTLLKPWHFLCIWLLSRKIRRQRRELAKFVRRSAYEISAWKQDIHFLDEQLEYHLALAGRPLPIVADGEKVVRIDEAHSPAKQMAQG